MEWEQGDDVTGTGKLPGIREISDNYYEVSDAAGLDAWAEIARDNLTARCILADDINYGTEKEWIPIGTYDNPYTGTFGNGKTLSNINISTSSGDYIGLFGCIGDNGTVKNLNVRRIEITSKNNNYIGVIAGGNKGTIAGCTIAEATITSATYNYIGGVVGWNMNRSNITACSFLGTIDGGSVLPRVGGVVGDTMGTVTSCWASCNFENVSGEAIGGVASSNMGSIIACYWQSDAVSNGVGANSTGDSETIKIGEDGSWADAVTAMNGKLQDWKWKYATNEYPTIVRVSI